MMSTWTLGVTFLEMLLVQVNSASKRKRSEIVVDKPERMYTHQFINNFQVETGTLSNKTATWHTVITGILSCI